jgi:hypothetical protein
LLEGRKTGNHRLSPLSRLAALTILTRENVRSVERRADGRDGRAFGVLAALVRQCPAYSISVGDRLGSLYDSVLPLLRA